MQLGSDVEDEGNQEVPTEGFSFSSYNQSSLNRLSPDYGDAPSQSKLRTQNDSRPFHFPSQNERNTVTSDANWQASCTGVKQRNAYMFNNELMADVHFVVGQSPRSVKIPAHTFVLATGSSVFYAMFYGATSMMTNRDEPIPIPDVEPPAFLNLLKYLYCDQIDLEADTVLQTLYVAKKYIVPHLAQDCVSFLETGLTAKNACILLSQSRLFEERDLMERCWEVIDAQAAEALQSEQFTDIDKCTLEAILDRETLNCKEIAVFNAALHWSHAECQRKGLNPTPDNMREVLGNCLYKIRIPNMQLEDYANTVAQSNILPLDVSHSIFLHFTAIDKPRLAFVCKPRKGLIQQRCHRFQSSAQRTNQWRYRGRCDSIQFSTDRRVFIAGLGLYGSSHCPAQYNVKIELKRSGVIVGHTRTSFQCNGIQKSYPICFESPLLIEPAKLYTASAILDGPELSYFGQEGLAEVNVGCVTFHFQCSSDSTNGTGVQGGQIPELLFYS